MMTFLLCEDFVESAKLLDLKRLGKQRIEGVQIVDAIVNGKGGWVSHPATKAWRNYLPALKYYINCIINEWISRGKNNNIPLYQVSINEIVYPWWVKWDRLHNSHKVMLLRKEPRYYQGKITVPDEYMNYGYIWPAELSVEDRDTPLSEITAPIPDSLLDAVFCKGLIKTGKNKGQECGHLVKTKTAKEYPYCNIHIKKICKSEDSKIFEVECSALFKSGKRKGESCGRKFITTDKSDAFCTFHNRKPSPKS